MYQRLYLEDVNNENIYLKKSKASIVDFHSHEFIEMLYILNGQALHSFEDKSSVLSEGDYLIVDYGTNHKYEQLGETALKVLDCMFIPRLFDETLSNRYQLEEITKNHMLKFNLHSLKGHPADFVYHDEDGRVRNLLETMYNEYQSKELGYQEILRSHLVIILVEMIRKIKDPNLVDTENDIVKLSVAYIQKHFPEKALLQKIAQKYNYSLSYISRIFKQETGQTMQEYIRILRIHEACRLLANTTYKVFEIAEMIGYEDEKFFTKIFKDETGTTPRQFRKSYNN